jgi:hypothetical protein
MERLRATTRTGPEGRQGGRERELRERASEKGEGERVGGREGGREVSWINDQPDDDGLFIDRNVANGTYRNRAGFCVLSHSYNNEGDKQNS